MASQFLIPSANARSGGRDAVYVAAVPLRAAAGPPQLVMSMAYSLNLWNSQHFMVLVKPSSPVRQEVIVFDFQPVNPESIEAAISILSGKSIPGVVMQRKLKTVPRKRCWMVGSSKGNNAMEMAIEFNSSWETETLRLKLDLSGGVMGAETVVEAEKVEDLLEAARYDDIDDLRSLASDGVSLDSRDSQGRTALHMAAANGHMNIVEYLISEGVDINALNEENNAPLHWACLNGHIEVVKRMILAGASLSLLNRYERTPMDEAIGAGKMEIIDAINTTVAQMELENTSVT